MRRLFTVDEYHRMVEAGILHEDDRVELLDGEIVEMTPIGPRHAGTVNLLNRLLIEGLRGRGVVTPQNPFLLDYRSEPQPDLCVARPRDDDYREGHPRPPDLLLVIEVSDSSLLWDRNRKVPRYAARGVPEVWLVDLTTNHLEVYRQPTPDGYAQTERLGPEETVSPSAFPDLVIATDDILA